MAAPLLQVCFWLSANLPTITSAVRLMKGAGQALQHCLSMLVEWASERGCRLLHLGGAANDAHGVYNFESSFGGPTYHYYTLDVIADEPKYQWLTEERTKFQLLPLMRDGFFPRYRA